MKLIALKNHFNRQRSETLGIQQNWTLSLYLMLQNDGRSSPVSLFSWPSAKLLPSTQRSIQHSVSLS